ncbi:hypothetical protein M8C21_030310 [Ambrosia artemisiifolia]|uniref:Uncharacterized protein n=1 Tax=Ambrosia artemisiifolia TaxID=4212 RepID=A0AAD5GYL4_AMBAR|nr:hypothetical protein M8C21_030310 [Ambrosia artemisiifolia]
MARSYLPSKVSEIVALWRKDLNKINQKAAESLADPEEYPNMFEDWQVALEVEARAAETRGTYPPATEYVNYVDRSHVNLVEVFKHMQLDDEEPHENGEHNYEGVEENENENEGEYVDGEEIDQEEDAIAMDNDSSDGPVLVNGNETEEEWGTNNAGNPSA